MSTVLALLAWRRRPASGAETFALLNLALAGWSIAYALKFGSADLSSMLFWDELSFFAVTAVPLTWFAFVLQYTGREKLLRHRNMAISLIVPLVTLLLVLTNDAHGLIYSKTALIALGSLEALNVTYGVWFGVHSTYSHLSILFGTRCFSKHSFVHSTKYM